MQRTLDLEQFSALRQLDTCTVANAIERFGVRLRNEGYSDGSIRSFFPALPPMLGYAATVRIRCSNPPLKGSPYVEHTDWWNHLLSTPAPRVVVIEDVDEQRGAGAFLGEMHANILQVLDCVGVVTNGAVRDLPGIAALGLPVFAAATAVSHAYAHIVEFGGAVEVGGLRVEPGDLLHGDCHGVLSVPLAVAAEVPAVAARQIEREREILAACHTSGFSPESLRTAIQKVFFHKKGNAPDPS